MTTDANQETEEEIDLDFIENVYFGKQGVGLDGPESTGEPLAETKPDEKTDEGDETPEGSNETPTNAEIKTYTEEELQAAVANSYASLRERAQAEQSRRQEVERAKELDDLIRNGDPEEAVKVIRERLNDQELREQIGVQEVGNYVALILPAIITPELMESLTPEEEASLDPKNFNNDAEYYKAATALRETKAKAGLFGEDEVKRRVKEEVEAQKNEARGQRVRQPSPTSTPRTSESDGISSLTGRAAKDAQWAAIEAGMRGESDE